MYYFYQTTLFWLKINIGIYMKWIYKINPERAWSLAFSCEVHICLSVASARLAHGLNQFTEQIFTFPITRPNQGLLLLSNPSWAAVGISIYFWLPWLESLLITWFFWWRWLAGIVVTWLFSWPWLAADFVIWTIRKMLMSNFRFTRINLFFKIRSHESCLLGKFILCWSFTFLIIAWSR